MKQFDDALNWRLLRFSHRFPGPDGGTCINEAAIVAAGFKYQRVLKVEHMPACFDRGVCDFALALNDILRFKDRQKLLPFVDRLAGTNHGWTITQRRSAYLNEVYRNTTGSSALHTPGHLGLWMAIMTWPVTGFWLRRKYGLTRKEALQRCFDTLEHLVDMGPGTPIRHSTVKERFEKEQRRCLELA